MKLSKVNKILLNYRKAVFLEKDSYELDRSLLMTMQTELANLGFYFSKDVLALLKTQEQDFALNFYNQTVAELKEMIGFRYNYRPLFRDFPKTTPEISRIRRDFIGILRNKYQIEEPNKYMSLLNGELLQKEELDENFSLKKISLVSKGEVLKIFTNVLNSKTPLSKKDKTLIFDIVEDMKENSYKFIPLDITQKETIALLTVVILKYCNNIPEELFKHYYNTATDVLRLATLLSDGDVSLSKNTPFRLTRKQRRLILSLLNSLSGIEEDLLRHKGKWKRLAHQLHVGEYSSKYPRAFYALDKLRNNEKSINTFNKNIEKAITNGEVENLVTLLKSRPGDFSRRLFRLLSIENLDNNVIVKGFSDVIDSIKTSILLTLKKNIMTRIKKSDFRYFVLKDGKMVVLDEDNRKLLSKEIIDEICVLIDKELCNRFSFKNKYKKILIDDSLKKIVLPLNQRESNSNLMNLTKGSIVENSEEKKYIRLFAHWCENDKTGRVDLDLSAMFLDNDYNYKGSVDYTNLEWEGVVHSGDFTSAPAPMGASEFIDVPIEHMKEIGVRYVVLGLYSFSNQNFSEYNSVAGFMHREDNNKGEIFEPKSVVNKFNIVNENRVVIPLVMDIVDNKMIWMDQSVKSIGFTNNIMGNKSEVIKAVKVACNLHKDKPSMYDLFELHKKAREDEEKEEELVIDKDILNKMDEIMGEWLA